MPIVTLPDGTQKRFDQPVSVYQIAASIGQGLAKAALAGRIGERLVDLSCLVDHDADVSIVTENHADGLDVIRHSAAHLLAQAVKRLFPAAQVTLGPVIDHGFYYDFYFEKAFTPEDIVRIEAMMHQIVHDNLPVVRREVSRDEAIAFFEKLGEYYKAKIIADIPPDETITLYTQGDFTDLCRGPHVPSTGKIKAFKLTKISGAYWRGDARNEMLQRIYGTAWADQASLTAYLQRIEEAEKRDHRKIAKVMDLFHMQTEAPGMVFWHDSGWRIYQTIEQYIRHKIRLHGYQEVNTPMMADQSFWEKSGHWQMFQKDMFTTESESRWYAVKPMNCPCHVQIFNQGIKSYRDLPLRLAEFGTCHRNESSGSLHGLMRVRKFTQDDAHIFCTEDQVQDEASAFIALLREVYRDFGFNELIVKLSTRPEQRIGSDEIWDKAEAALAQALRSQGMEFQLSAGEGAFYGPKIEFSLKDCLERVWQVGTLQLDYAMPARLGAEYVAHDNTRRVPVMLHRAILGSFERFIGILLEHYAGHLPLWLAPRQIVVMTITEAHNAYAQQVVQQLQQHGLRALIDLRNEKIGFKIREHTVQRVPYLAIIGDRERDTQTLSIRKQDGTDLGSKSLSVLVDELSALIAQKVS